VSSLSGDSATAEPFGAAAGRLAGPTALPPLRGPHRRMRRASPPGAHSLGSELRAAPKASCLRGAASASARPPRRPAAADSIASRAPPTPRRASGRDGRTRTAPNRPRRLPAGVRRRPADTVRSRHGAASRVCRAIARTFRLGGRPPSDQAPWCHGTLGSSRWCLQVAQLRRRTLGALAASAAGAFRHGTVIEHSVAWALPAYVVAGRRLRSASQTAGVSRGSISGVVTGHTLWAG
jgi:hypothetical protein